MENPIFSRSSYIDIRHYYLFLMCFGYQLFFTFVLFTFCLCFVFCFCLLGTASPQAVRKLMSLSEPGKTRQRRAKHSVSSLHSINSPPGKYNLLYFLYIVLFTFVYFCLIFYLFYQDLRLQQMPKRSKATKGLSRIAQLPSQSASQLRVVQSQVYLPENIF